MPTHPRAAPQWVLLDMISSAQSPDPIAMAQFSGAQWDSLALIAGEHRVEPLLHYRLRARGKKWPVPASLAARWERAYLRSARRSLAMAAGLSRLHTLFEAAGIRWVVLKGPFLAWHAWPEPQLRPSRDIDILVERSNLFAAYQTLRTAGFRPIAGFDPAQDAPLHRDRHLPALIGPGDGPIVELHSRPFDAADRAAAAGFADTALARSRHCTIAGKQIGVLAPDDMLIHLIAHAAIDSGFNNGPLLLGDVSFLIHAHVIDWPDFWERVRSLGLERSALLTLALSERYEGTFECGRPGPAAAEVPSALVDAAALLTVADYASRVTRDVRAIVNAGTWRLRIATLAKRAIPRTSNLRRFAGRRWARVPLLLVYPFWALRYAADFIAGHFQVRRNPETSAAVAVRDWLVR